MTEALQTIWVRHTWDLTKLRVITSAPPGYHFETAAASNVEEVIAVVLAAYGSDPIWSKIIDAIAQRMTPRVATTIGTSGCEYLVAKSQSRIVAVSGIAVTHWTDQNLLTGICTLPDHQRKGLGKHLLGLSLVRLRDMGLSHAQVYTESGSVADRKIYPLFGSHREENVHYPGAVERPPAASTTTT
jgi:ribosomal protein S18 acetylase RimI-like enzyme